MTDKRLIKLIIKDIIWDLQNRRGIGNEWDAIDEDIQKDIKDEWAMMIQARLSTRDEK